MTLTLDQLVETSADARRQTIADACWGNETDWFAMDADGHVSVVSTAGFGPIPAYVLDQLEAIARSLDNMSAVPEVSDVEWLPSSPDRFNAWIPLVRRGLYAFDWAVTDFAVIARPLPAIRATDPRIASIATLARLARFNICFADVRELSLADADLEWYWPGKGVDRASRE